MSHPTEHLPHTVTCYCHLRRLSGGARSHCTIGLLRKLSKGSIQTWWGLSDPDTRIAPELNQPVRVGVSTAAGVPPTRAFLLPTSRRQRNRDNAVIVTAQARARCGRAHPSHQRQKGVAQCDLLPGTSPLPLPHAHAPTLRISPSSRRRPFRPHAPPNPAVACASRIKVRTAAAGYGTASPTRTLTSPPGAPVRASPVAWSGHRGVLTARKGMRVEGGLASARILFLARLARGPPLPQGAHIEGALSGLQGMTVCASLDACSSHGCHSLSRRPPSRSAGSLPRATGVHVKNRTDPSQGKETPRAADAC